MCTEGAYLHSVVVTGQLRSIFSNAKNCVCWETECSQFTEIFRVSCALVPQWGQYELQLQPGFDIRDLSTNSPWEVMVGRRWHLNLLTKQRTKISISPFYVSRSMREKASCHRSSTARTWATKPVRSSADLAVRSSAELALPDKVLFLDGPPLIYSRSLSKLKSELNLSYTKNIFIFCTS